MNIRKILFHCVISILSLFGASDVIKAIDRGIATLDPNTVSTAPLHLQDAVTRVVTLFAGIRPLLAGLSTLLPKAWRAGLDAFIASLDALSTSAHADFKAGKDV